MANDSRQKGGADTHKILRALMRIVEVPFVLAGEIIGTAAEVIAPPETSRG